jgi:hypothetical protein
LPLPFGNHPVFDSDALPRVRVWPPRDVSGGPDPRSAGLQVRVHEHAALDREACPFRQLQEWSNANAEHDKASIKSRAVLQNH